jgi:hypothetical protein
MRSFVDDRNKVVASPRGRRVRDAAVVEGQLGVPAGERASMAPMTRSIRMPGLPASTRNMVAPSEARAMQIAKAAPSPPAMNHLRPVIDQPRSTRAGRVASIEGAGPAPGAGSVIAKPERT